MPEATQNDSSSNSSFLEKLREYVFLSEILKEAWFSRELTVDVLRAEVDNSGYDLALECEGTIRFIQLKSSWVGSKTATQKVNVKLAEKPGGCVIWLFQDDSDHSVELKYRFFGGGPGEPPELGEKVGKHTKGNAEGEKLLRPNTRIIGIGKFDKPVNANQLFEKLFPNRNS